MNRILPPAGFELVIWSGALTTQPPGHYTRDHDCFIHKVSRLQLAHFLRKRLQKFMLNYTVRKNKSTASIIPHHSNYLFMYLSYRCENVWKENDGGTDNNPEPDLDNINGQITILKQILIISMHIGSLVKRPCY